MPDHIVLIKYTTSPAVRRPPWGIICIILDLGRGIFSRNYGHVFMARRGSDSDPQNVSGVILVLLRISMTAVT